MKILTLVLALIALTTVGCKHGVNMGVQGSGKREVQKRDVQAFTSISSMGAFNVEVVAQKAQSVEIEGDDNILPLISTEVSNNVLRIKNDKGFSINEPIVVRISVPDLAGLNVSGAGKISISGLKNDKFEIDCDGAPMIKVSGQTKVIDINTNGAAKIDTHSLHAATGVIESNGVSKIDVDVKDQLTVTITGTSIVTYEGDPAIVKTIHGPGKVVKRESEGAFQIRMADENPALRIATCDSCHLETITIG
jgi:hypothetical protein